MRRSGFTMLEILLVVAAIAILAGIVIVAINPGKQLAETRNAQRSTSVNTILSAVGQYAIDNSGSIPTGIASSGACTVATNEVCNTGAASCAGLVDLSVITNNGTYLVALPVDPSGGSTNGSGYHIVQTASGRLEVCAPSAEQGVTISAQQ